MVINENQLTELEQFFSKTKLPTNVKFDSGITITDVPRFVDSHLGVLRNNHDKPIYEVFYQRLVMLKEKLG